VVQDARSAGRRNVSVNNYSSNIMDSSLDKNTKYRQLSHVTAVPPQASGVNDKKKGKPHFDKPSDKMGTKGNKGKPDPTDTGMGMGTGGPGYDTSKFSVGATGGCGKVAKKLVARKKKGMGGAMEEGVARSAELAKGPTVREVAHETGGNLKKIATAPGRAMKAVVDGAKRIPDARPFGANSTHSMKNIPGNLKKFGGVAKDFGEGVVSGVSIGYAGKKPVTPAGKAGSIAGSVLGAGPAAAGIVGNLVKRKKNQ
jgi:hypothetical protein